MDSIKTLKEVEQEHQARLLQMFKDDGYDPIRVLPDGTICAIHSLIFTTALFIGMDALTYDRRYCFKTWGEAIDQLNKLTSGDDVPVGFIASRG